MEVKALGFTRRTALSGRPSYVLLQQDDGQCEWFKLRHYPMAPSRKSVLDYKLFRLNGMQLELWQYKRARVLQLLHLVEREEQTELRSFRVTRAKHPSFSCRSLSDALEGAQKLGLVVAKPVRRRGVCEKIFDELLGQAI